MNKFVFIAVLIAVIYTPTSVFTSEESSESDEVKSFLSHEHELFEPYEAKEGSRSERKDSFMKMFKDIAPDVMKLFKGTKKVKG